MAHQTSFDKLLDRLKDNRVIAALLVVAMAVGGLSAFTDAVQKIARLTGNGANVAGIWRTEAFVNPYDESERSMLIFDLVQSGETVLGTVTEIDQDGSNGVTRSVRGGSVKGNAISFHTEGEVSYGDDKLRLFRDAYVGSVARGGNEILFRRHNELPEGGIEETVVAKRATRGG